MSNNFKLYQKELSNCSIDTNLVRKHKMNKVDSGKLEQKYANFYRNYTFDDDCFDDDYCNYINWLLGEI